MGPSTRLLAIVVCACLFLSGCKIKVSVFGEGQVSAVTPDIPTCTSAPGDLCLNAGYNRTVELQATPAQGYVFTGWSGACSGSGNCSLTSLGDRHAVAVFSADMRTTHQLIPAMRYIDDFFFSGPWPSDIRRDKNGTLDFDDYPVGNGLLAKSSRAEASRQTGFARNGSLYVTLLNDLPYPLPSDWKMPYAYSASPNSQIQLVNLSPESPRYLQRIPLEAHLHSGANVQVKSQLRISPQTGQVLEPDTTYGFIMFEQEPADIGDFWWVAKSRHMQAIIDHGATGLLGEHWNRIRDYVSSHTAFAPGQVAAFSLFTTQPVNPDYAVIRQFLASQDLEIDSYIRRIDDTNAYDCNESNPFSHHTRLRQYELNLPYILTGKPPYLLTGGRLNKGMDGRIVATDTPILTTMVMTLPCTEADADTQLPVEIHSLPTGYTIQEFWNEHLLLDEQPQADQNVIRVFIAAPHTSEREYSSGYQSLSLLTDLTGIESRELTVFLGDFNPINIASIEPQYMQYAMEILYVKALLRQMNLWGQQEQEWMEQNEGEIEHSQFADFSNARPDLDDITLVGISLGGLSSLHANAIDPTHRNLVLSYMPRPNAWHINNVWDYLDQWTSPAEKDNLGKVIGVNFPVERGDPLLGLLQTAIDGVDPNSLLMHTREQNTLLVLADFDNKLHGGHASYSVAAAFDRQFGLKVPWSPYWYYVSSFEDYIVSPLHPQDIPVTDSPARILIPLERSAGSILSFSSQMKDGNGFLYAD